MATVDEILATQAHAAVDEAWAKDNNYPSFHLYVEPEYVPVTNKRIADFNDQISVRGEENAQFVGFQLPRYDDGLDLTVQHLYIHYQTVHGGGDSVPCNVSWSDNYVRMCWQIPAQATQELGSIQMMIYATGTDSVGERTIWKTLPATYDIHDGLEIGGGIVEPDPSWYEQFVAQMESRVSTAQGYANDAQVSKTAASGSATAAAESAAAAEKTLQDTKDYIDLKKSEFIGYSKRASDIKYANAIIGSATGTTQVTVPDAWEAPIPGLEIAGRSEQVVMTGAQMLDLRAGNNGTSQGVIYTNNGDGTYKRTGTALSNAGTNWFLGGYNLIPADDGSNVIVTLEANQKYTVKDCILYTSVDGASKTYEGTFTPLLEVKITGVRGPMQVAGTSYDDTITPMVNKGDAMPWEPYTGGKPSPSPDNPQEIVSTDVKTVTVIGTNLLNADTVVMGLVDANTGELNAANTHFVGSDFIPVSPGDYVLSGVGITPYINYAVFYGKDKKIFELVKGRSFNKSTGTVNVPAGVSYMRVRFISKDGTTGTISVEEVKALKPMLNIGDTALPWQPYQSKTAAIALVEPLRGIGDVRDHITCRDGVWGVVRYMESIVFDGSEDEIWSEVNTNTDGNKRYTFKCTERMADTAHPTALCSHFPLLAEGATNLCITGFTIKNNIVIYLDGRLLDEFKSWLRDNPITLVCTLNSPTWEPLPADTQSALNALTTYTGTTHVTITAGGPEPDVTIGYVQDTRMVIADLQAQIDTIRNGGTT